MLDDARVDLLLRGQRPHPEAAVLRLKDDVLPILDARTSRAWAGTATSRPGPKVETELRFSTTGILAGLPVPVSDQNLLSIGARNQASRLRPVGNDHYDAARRVGLGGWGA